MRGRHAAATALVRSAVAAIAIAAMLAVPVWATSPNPSAPSDSDGAWALPLTSSAVGPMVATPSTALPAPNWGNLSTGPVGSAPPSSGTLVYDAADGYTLWIGGFARNDSVVQTWKYGAGQWTNLTGTLPVAPPTSVRPAATFDASDGEVVFVAGVGGGAELTWGFSTGGWTNLTAPNGSVPSPRQAPGLADDPACACVVLFGGLTNGTYRADTWTFAAGNWSEVHPTVSPPGRASAGMAFDRSTATLVLAGGVDAAGPRGDTWTFNGTAWSPLASAPAPPGIAVGANALAAVPGGALVGFGGVGCGAAALGLCNRTYEFTGGSWTTIGSANPPSARPGMELAYDAADGYVVGFGGGLAGEEADETWALGGPLSAQLSVTPTTVQAPNSTTITTRASGGYGPYAYVYTFTDSEQAVNCPSQNRSSYVCVLDLDDVGNRSMQVAVTDGAGNTTVAPGFFFGVPPFTAGLVLSAAEVDVGLPFTASVVTPLAYPGVNFTWFGLPADCGTVSTGSFSCTSSLPGSYAIACTVVDAIGTRQTTATVALQVHTDPVVGAWPSRIAGSAPLDVGFTASVAGGTAPYTFAWSFGDGAVGSGPSTNHTFDSTGHYLVWVNVTDAVGWTTAAELANPVAVGAPLVATITAPGTLAPAPTAIVLTGSASGGEAPYDLRWTLPGGTNESGTPVSLPLPSPGTYAVTLTVVDAAGSSAQTSTVFTVVAPNGTASGALVAPPLLESVGLSIAAGAVGVVAGWILARPRRPRPTPPPRERVYPDRQ